jgi:phytoene desaturase
MVDYDVIVIGAGCGGMTSGALLAHQGRKVLVLEQSKQIGGCCSTFEVDGFRFDTGASIVEIIQPIEKVFQALDTTFQKEVDLIPCDPMMSIIRRDGSKVTYPISVEETGRMISEMSPEDGRRWFEFASFSQELMDVSLNTIFSSPANSFADMAAMVKKDPRLVKFLPYFLISYEDLIKKYFKNPDVLETMTYQSLYFGHPPSITPGAYGMVPYTEHTGIYYPRGGMIRIPEALQRCGEKYGMVVKTEAKVQKIIMEGKHVHGVRLADGTEITANIVVSDINARTLYLKLIGQEFLPAKAIRAIKSYDYSLSVPMIYLGLDERPPLEAHHSIVAISPEELDRFWWNNVQTGVMSEKTFGLICWPTYSDSSLAPEGQHVLNLIPDGFYHLKGKNWDDEKEGYINRTIDQLEKFALPDIKKHIKVMECSSPLDYERKLLLPEGAIYAFQQDLTAQAMFRPSSKAKTVEGLYLVGSSTHPGGGVPSTIASGMIASNLIAKYEN